MMAGLSRMLLRGGAILVLMGAGGCAQIEPVQAWQKGTLARPEMRFGADRLDTTFEEHVYSSKEAASGGTGDAVGGCGCN